MVDRDQTCRVPGRFIGENGALLRDVVDFAFFSDTPVAVLSLDQKRLSTGWIGLLCVPQPWALVLLSLYGLIFFTTVSKALSTLMAISPPIFGLCRGVRRGCILSPLLYVLVSEVLAVNIRCNRRISTLCLPGSSILSPISQYADDTSLILTSDNAIKAVFESYAMFEKASGSRILH